jgi:pimeloyl-ACP methyl ester carboxylesterase
MHTRKKQRSKKRWPWVAVVVLLLIGLWLLFTNLYKEEEKTLRSRVRETVKKKFPEQTAKFSQTIGLFHFKTGKKVSDVTGQFNRSVVLVHGLDDPGKVWQVLAPELVKHAFDVWLLHYPNDQPVVESARLFFDELKQLAQLRTHQISIVAHSMGGLVSREMLTDPELAYARAADAQHVPRVEMLIMVGTPNHGSQVARFRVFGEIRDHLVRISKGDANWLGAILDGAGEAKIDLLPNSRFLNELNTRPHPPGVDMLIIAGIASPWNENDINRWVGNVRQQVSPDQQEQVDAFGDYMISMTHGLGDGLVTVESTRLEGIPHLTVDGTHLSIIRNITRDSQRIPPAVPIIVDQLTQRAN